MRTCRNSVTRIALVTFLNFAVIIPCFAAFTLDSTFDGDGRVTRAFPDSTTNYSAGGLRIFVQPSGRIIAVGAFTNMSADGQMAGVAVTGITASGGPDPTYSTLQDWQGHGFTSLSDTAMYPDGRLLMLTRFFNVVGSSTVRAGRLNVNGGGDTVFGSNVNIGTSPGNFGTDRGVQIAAQTDGKVLVLIIFNFEYTLYRLNPDGTRDTTFGTNGALTIRFNKISSSAILEMIPLADGRIIITGQVPPLGSDASSSDFFVARLTASGNWDKTFGRAGFLQVPFGSGITGRINRAIIQSDGNLLLCGAVFNPDMDLWMMRFRPNGRVDTSFGNNGVVITDFQPGGSDAAASMSLSSDGKIRIAGFHGTPSSFLVARYSASGAFEESTSFTFTPGQNSAASDIALQPDGKIVVIGGTRNPDTTINGGVFAIARLTE